MAMMKDEPKLKPIIRLIGHDGNAFAILGKVKRALVQAGMNEKVEGFIQKATAGNYHHLLATVMEYCEVE